MFSVGEILGVLSSTMAILDGGDEVVIGLDFADQLVAHDLDEIVEVPPINSAIGKLVKSVFYKENGVEETVFGRADHWVSEAS